MLESGVVALGARVPQPHAGLRRPGGQQRPAAKGLRALNDAERRKAELAIRRDLAIGLQAETEERILTTEGTRAEQAKLAHRGR